MRHFAEYEIKAGYTSKNLNYTAKGGIYARTQNFLMSMDKLQRLDFRQLL